jgi:hypothetical protein
VIAVPTTGLAADWLLGRHAWFGQTAAPPPNAQEVVKLYQLREFCNQSNVMEKRFDFAIQKLRDKKAEWNHPPARRKGETANPGQVTIHFGPRNNPTLYDPDFMDADSNANPLAERRNRQIQNLRARNSRYLETMFQDVAKYGAENPAVWGAVQARHEKLARIMQSGDFQSCMEELDEVLPAQAKQGGPR